MFHFRILRLAARALVSSLTAVALISPTIGCYTYRAVAAPRVGQDLRLKFEPGTPLDVVKGDPVTDTLHLRSVSMLDGRLVRVNVDTLQLRPERIRPFVYASASQRALVPLTATVSVTERKFSTGRTLLLVGGLSVILLGFAAFAASQMEFDWSESGSGGYRIAR